MPRGKDGGNQALVRPNYITNFEQFEGFLDPSNKFPFTSVSFSGFLLLVTK